MRLKHVRGARGKIEASPYVIQGPEEYRGSYHKLFNNMNPIHVEIGVGKGNFIIENAKRYPGINFIGIEKYDSVLVRTVEKLYGKELPNLKLICVDANYIENLFDHEINTIYLNFSDPWPKNRHARRRLTSPNFLDKYENIFESQKRIVQKTDNRNLFEYSLISFTSYGYHLEKISLNLHEDNDITNIETEYETKFASQGSIIYKVEVIKK